ncbi:hypothetical protein RRG08_010143 [Elysia crispata]|uniref:Secreted protein n=1 Tax=Elysia crispata TaxID=231223 RepID=A0AAE1CWB5_9GAST|nr:hypothetical protein RRG08_010143 [Elysia crispata]
MHKSSFHLTEYNTLFLLLTMSQGAITLTASDVCEWAAISSSMLPSGEPGRFTFSAVITVNLGINPPSRIHECHNLRIKE